MTVTDAGGLSHTETLSIGVTNVNEAPIDLTVSGGTVAENAAAGTVVATLGASDPDAGSSFTYTITDPSGKFEVVGDEIRVKAGASLDHESAAAHQLQVTVTDAGGLSHTETLSIGVTNVNEAPIDLTVSGGTVAENAAAGTVVATLGASDPDAGSSFTYTITDPSGKFEVVGDEIRVKAGASLDHESAAAHQLQVTVTDAGGLSHTETLSIGVTNVNEAPIDLTVERRHGGGERGGRHGGGDAGGQRSGCRVELHLYDHSIPPASSRWSATRSASKPAPASTTRAPRRISCSVTVTDAGGLSHTETLSIAVTNVNEAPIDLTVSGGTVAENAAAGTVVATLGATDPDAGSSFTYTLTRSLGQVRGGRRRDPRQSRRQPRLRERRVASAAGDGDRRRRPQPHRDAEHRRHQSERSPDRPHGQRRHGGGERRGRHGGGDAGRHRSGCRVDLHLYAHLDPSGKFEVVGDEIRVKAGASLDHESAASHQLQRDGDRRRRPQPHRDAEHRRDE